MSELTYSEIDQALSDYEQVAVAQQIEPGDAEANALIRQRTAGVAVEAENARDDGELLTDRPVTNVTLSGDELQNGGAVETIPVQSRGDHDRSAEQQDMRREPAIGRQALRAPVAARSTDVEADTSADPARQKVEVEEDPVHHHRQVVATEFRRILAQHGHEPDLDTHQIFDVMLSGADVPADIRMRKIFASSSGQHVVIGDEPAPHNANMFADTPGVMVAGSGSKNVDRLVQYEDMTDEQILHALGDEPDAGTFAKLASALSACEVDDRPRRIYLPTDTERAESNRARAARVRLINEATAEAAGEQRDTPAKAGPYHGDFRAILARIDQELAKINAATGLSLTSESLVPESYQSREAKRENNELFRFRDGRRALTELIWARKVLIRELLIDKIDMTDQTIPDGLLTEPDYLRMGSDHKACFNACFRMICADITGQSLSEYEVSYALEKVHGQSLVADEEYMKILESNAVSELSGYSVKAIEFFGADLDYIAKLASIVKDRRPDAQVYSIVSLETESGGNADIWHTNVVLGADKDYVYCHDPSSANKGAPNRPIKKAAFTRRWATTYNRGYIVFALPKNRSEKAAA